MPVYNGNPQKVVQPQNITWKSEKKIKKRGVEGRNLKLFLSILST